MVLIQDGIFQIVWKEQNSMRLQDGDKRIIICGAIDTKQHRKETKTRKPGVMVLMEPHKRLSESH